MNKENTVSKELVEEKWDGRVKVFKLKQFADDRGMVCETFRLDDEITSNGKMCYISETEPFVIRGPHEHSSQVDNFISWKNLMAYELYNPDKDDMFHFITDKENIYLVTVDVGIIHAYRNLDLESMKTMNFPTSLFMGENKQEEIDEIRHEDLVSNDKSIIVIGAGGRLGKSLVNELYKNNGYYKTNIIPVYKKMNCKEDVESTLLSIQKQVEHTKVVVVNCAAKTNVQENDIGMFWVNVDMPIEINNFCEKYSWKSICFSSDYVFKTNVKEYDKYTISKQMLEDKLKNSKTIFIRVSNLFGHSDLYKKDLIQKLNNKIKKNEEIEITNQLVFMTSYNELSKFISNKIINEDINSNLNIAGTPYKLEHIIKHFFNYNKFKIIKKLGDDKWYEIFNKKIDILLDCYEDLKNHIEFIQST